MARRPLNLSEGSRAWSYRLRSQSLQEFTVNSLTVNLFQRHSSFYKKVICFTGQRWHLALSSFSLELVVNASFTDPAMTLRLIKYLSILFLCVVVVLFLRLVPPSLQCYHSYCSLFYILLPSAAILLNSMTSGPIHTVKLQLVVILP